MTSSCHRPRGVHELGISTFSAGDVLLDSFTATFTVVHAAAARYQIVDPTDGTVDASIPVTVRLVDQYGNVVTTGIDKDKDVTLVATARHGAAWSTSPTASGRLASPTRPAQTVNLSLTDSGSTGFAVTSTQSVVFGVGVLAGISMVTQPSGLTVAGVAFAQQPVVQLEDQHGNDITSGASATASVTATPAAGSLGGTTTVAAVGALATFADLSRSVTGATRDRVQCRWGRPRTSATFAITHAATGPPHPVPGAGPGEPARTPLEVSIVQVRDAFENVVTTGPEATVAATVTMVSGGGVLGGTTTAAAAEGEATFSDLDDQRVRAGRAALHAGRPGRRLAGLRHLGRRVDDVLVPDRRAVVGGGRRDGLRPR